MTKCTIH